MAKIFISHPSNDKELVRQRADDLREMGHKVWLDEWEIKVGDCIVTKMEAGIADADYVVLVLSGHSVTSGWVEREWKTKYAEEVADGRVGVLPALIETCEIPPFLRTKNYADFRKSYGVGFLWLVFRSTSRRDSPPHSRPSGSHPPRRSSVPWDGFSLTGRNGARRCW
jgi:hypothetical protein